MNKNTLPFGQIRIQKKRILNTCYLGYHFREEISRLLLNKKTDSIFQTPYNYLCHRSKMRKSAKRLHFELCILRKRKCKSRN